MNVFSTAPWRSLREHRERSFPIALARMAAAELTRAGADVTFRAIAYLSHTCPHEENGAILTWFEPSLALP